MVTPARTVAYGGAPGGATLPSAPPVAEPAAAGLELEHTLSSAGQSSMAKIATTELQAVAPHPAPAGLVAPQPQAFMTPDSAGLVLSLDPGGSMPDGAHVDKLGRYEQTPVADEPSANERPSFVKEGHPNIMCWFASGRWWVGKRLELGQARGFLKAPGNEKDGPPRKGWLVISTTTKPPSWKEVADLSCQFVNGTSQKQVKASLLPGSHVQDTRLSADPVKRATMHQTKLAQIFSDADADGSGALTREEITKALKAKTNLSSSEIDEFFSVCDRNHDGTLTMMEAMRGFKALQRNGKLSELT